MKEKKTKRLIWCPLCEKDTGKKEVLGEEIDEDIQILRYKKGFTLVRGSFFALICPVHNEVIFSRNEL